MALLTTAGTGGYYPYNPYLAGYTPSYQGQMQQGPQQSAGGSGLLSPNLAFKAVNKFTGLGSAITSGVNNFGATTLGTGYGSGFVGPLQAGAGTATASSLSGILGAGGIGYMAGGPIAGMLGGNKTGGSIGGALGGALGSYAAGTATGAAMGAALGLGAQALNFVIPGLGIIAGAAIGSLFGGGKKPHPTSEYVGTIGDTGDMSKNFSIGSKHLDHSFAQSLSGGMNGYLKTLKDQFGINAAGQIVRGGYHDGKGYLSATKSGTKGLDPYGIEDTIEFNFNPDSPQEQAKAMTDFGLHLARASGASKETLDKIAAYGAQMAQGNSGGQGGQGNGPVGMVGIPMANVRGADTKESFDTFIKRYRESK